MRPAARLSLLFAALLALGASVGCAGAKKPEARALAEVEQTYDTPREYRRHAPLPCGVGSGLVYVFTSAGELAAFEPLTGRFRRIGPIRCPGVRRGLARPNSMAVDRAGTAWINYIDGPIFAVSTRDGTCRETGYTPGQHGFWHLGMAYVSTGPTLSGETLFISGGERGSNFEDFGIGNAGGPGGLARIENGEKVVPIAPFTGRLNGRLAELTGTGDGRLFGFFSTRPATLAEIDPATAAIKSERTLPGISAPSAWAHAFWGGRFYLFWSRAGEASVVSRVELDGRVEHLGRSPRMTIVGAGVSTCAPTTLE